MKKTERLNFIKELILYNPIDTQEEIVERLREVGIVATQATVSRDIKELGIIKVPSKTNGYIYGFPTASGTKFQTKNIREIAVMGNMISAKVVPGSSVAVKRRVLEYFEKEIFSIISDDDSILIIVKELASIPKLEQAIKVW